VFAQCAVLGAVSASDGGAAGVPVGSSAGFASALAVFGQSSCGAPPAAGTDAGSWKRHPVSVSWALGWLTGHDRG